MLIGCRRDEEWQRVLDASGFSVVYLRDKRYDCILHLVTAADGMSPLVRPLHCFCVVLMPQATEKTRKFDHMLARSGPRCLRCLFCGDRFASTCVFSPKTRQKT